MWLHLTAVGTGTWSQIQVHEERNLIHRSTKLHIFLIAFIETLPSQQKLKSNHKVSYQIHFHKGKEQGLRALHSHISVGEFIADANIIKTSQQGFRFLFHGGRHWKKPSVSGSFMMVTVISHVWWSHDGSLTWLLPWKISCASSCYTKNAMDWIDDLTSVYFSQCRRLGIPRLESPVTGEGSLSGS